MNPQRREDSKKSASTGSPKKKSFFGRLLKWTIIVLVLLAILIFALGPMMVSKFGTPKITEALNAHFGGTSSIKDLSFSWPGSIEIAGLEVKDHEGQPLLGLGKVSGKVGLLGAIRGNYDVTLEVDQPEVVVRELADGSFNFQPKKKTEKEKSSGSSKDKKSEDKSKITAPNVKANVEIKNGRLRFVAKDGQEIVFDTLSAKATVPSLEEASDIVAELGGAKVGNVKLTGKVTVASGGVIDTDKMKGAMTLELDRIAFAALKPLLASMTPLRRLEGEANGKWDYRFEGLTNIDGGGELLVRKLHAEGEALGTKPLLVQELRLTDKTKVEGEGRTVQHLELTADQYLKVIADNVLAKGAAETKTLESNVALDADLNGLSRAAAGLLRLKDGVTLGGRANITSKSSAVLGGQEGVDAAAVITGKIQGLSATDAQGRALPVDPTLDLVFDGRLAPGGSVNLNNGVVKMGQVNIVAKGGFDSKTKKLGSSTLNADANLDDLSAKLSSFMDLPVSFGGRVKIDAKAEGASDRTATTAKAEVKGFWLKTAEGKKAGPIDIDLEQAGTIDLAVGGKSTLDRFELKSDLVSVSATGSGTDVTDAELMKGDAKFSVQANPSLLQARLGDFLSGYGLSGQPVAAQGQAKFSKSSTDLVLDVEAPELAVTGDAFAPEGARIRSARIHADLAMDANTRTNTLKDIKVFSGDVTVTTKGAKAPTNLRDLALELVGAKKGDDLELKRIDLKSSVANGSGSALITKMGQEGMSAQGDLSFSGQVGALLDLARGFSPDLATARGSGQWDLKFKATTQGKNIVITETLTTNGLAIQGVKAGEKVLDVANANVELRSEAEINSGGQGSATIKSCVLRGPGVDVALSGGSSNFLGEKPTPRHTYKIAGTVDPTELNQRLAAFLMGYETRGQVMSFTTDLDLDGDKLLAKGNVRAPDVTIVMPAAPGKPDRGVAARTIAQKDLVLDYDIERVATLGQESLLIRTANYKSQTGTLIAQGNTRGKEKMAADLRFTADIELADVLRDLGALLDLADRELKGKAKATVAVKGQEGKLDLVASTVIDNFLFVGPGPDGNRVTVTDPKVELTADAAMASETGDFTIRKGNLSSSFIRGDVTGSILGTKTIAEFKDLKGTFYYIPEKLGTLLAPFMSAAEFSGTTEQKTTFAINGRASDSHWLSLLRNSTGATSIGLTQFSAGGFDITGSLNTEFKEQKVISQSTMGMNAGVLRIDSNIDLQESPNARSTIKLALEKGAANKEMSPILDLISPIFAVASGATGGLIQGLLDVNLDLNYNGQITKEMLQGGWDAFPKQPINGRGRFAISNLAVQGASVIGTLLSTLDEGSSASSLTIDPVEILIQNGRLGYVQPLIMAISGTKTQWVGTIGLDKTLDLIWEVPVTDKLIKKHAFLSFFKGESLRIPVKGTSSSPEIKIEALFADLAQQALKKQAGGAIGDLLGGKGIPGLGGNQNPPPPPPPQPPAGTNPQGTPPGTNPPPPPPPAKAPDPIGDLLGGVLGGGDEKKASELLTQADTLYNQNKKSEAAALYKKLREKYPKTDAYKKNKARTEPREKEQ